MHTVENGLITKAVPVQNSKETLVNCIKNLHPFECTDWDILCDAFIEAYDPDWMTSPIWTVSLVRGLQRFEKMQGSWNAPVRLVYDYQKERELYKVFRQHKELKNNVFVKEISYEFHPAKVEGNKWLDCEISGSPSLTGMKPKEEGGTGGRFHMIVDELQANLYLMNRVNSPWFTPQEAVVKKVKGKNFQTIDLLYVPPKLFLWGVDATNMYVEL